VSLATIDEERKYGIDVLSEVAKIVG